MCAWPDITADHNRQITVLSSTAKLYFRFYSSAVLYRRLPVRPHAISRRGILISVDRASLMPTDPGSARAAEKRRPPCGRPPPSLPGISRPTRRLPEGLLILSLPVSTGAHARRQTAYGIQGPRRLNEDNARRSTPGYISAARIVAASLINRSVKEPLYRRVAQPREERGGSTSSCAVFNHP